MKRIAYILLIFYSCSTPAEKEIDLQEAGIWFEKINYYKADAKGQADKPFQSRVTYYFNNSKLHRWIERDSLDRLKTDYIVEYDENWIQTGALYTELEEGETFDGNYSVERVSFSGDTLKTTEWLDSTGNVYYQMIEDLNGFGLPNRAAFIGDKLHGYDSAYYTPEGFEKRIFFTSTKGTIYNDRLFEYVDINEFGDWTQRKKIMEDTLREIHIRELRYQGEEYTNSGKFYEGVISTGEWSENVMSLNDNEDVIFFTKGDDWLVQFGYLATKENGIFTTPEKIQAIDTIYNGAISPSGNQIIYSKRLPERTDIWLIERNDGNWSDPVNLSKDSGLEGGYFNWFNENEIYFYVPENNGDLVVGNLANNRLSISERLEELNSNATEFSPFVGKEKRYLIFTRYVEGDESQQGFFISYNQGNSDDPIWSEATKIESLPYGWGAFISKDQKVFYYTDGKDIYSKEVGSLGIQLK